VDDVMSGLRRWLRLAACIFVATTAVAAVGATPAAAVDPPTCWVSWADSETASGMCANGSFLWSFQYRMYCTLDQTDGTPAYSIVTPWTSTTQENRWRCGPGFYNNNYDQLELRFNGA
jgi:hypothetical protein